MADVELAWHQVARFSVAGRFAPWATPIIGTGSTTTGRRYRYVTPSPKLKAWQAQVQLAARLAMAGRRPATGPTCLRLEFTAACPPGVSPGTPWCPDVQWNEAVGAWVKVGIGCQIPDLTNLFKGTEDALQGSVIGDDGTNCFLWSSRLYGAGDGVTVTLYEIETPHAPDRKGDRPDA